MSVQETNDRPPLLIWTIAVFVTIVTAIAGLVFAVVAMYNALDGNPAARTVPAVLIMVVGVLGFIVPILLIRNRGRFVLLARKTQWLLTAAISGGLVLGWFLIIDAADEIDLTPVLPYTNTLILRMDPDGRFQWDLKPAPPAASFVGFENASNDPAPGFPFTRQVGITTLQDEPLELTGSIKQDESKHVEFEGTLSIKELTRLKIVGFTDLVLTLNENASSSNSKLKAGKYRIVFSGNVK